MTNRQAKIEFLLAILLTLLMSWMTFDKLIGIRFTNADDMYFSIASFESVKDYFSVASTDAKDTGRFGMYYATVYNGISSNYWDTPILDLALYGSVSVVLILILFLARYLGNLLLGLLFVTLYLALIPVTFEFNLLVSYPFRYTSGIILWLLSLIAIEKYLRSSKVLYLWVACAATFLAFAHHETLFAVFATVNVVFAVLRQRDGSLCQRLFHRSTICLAITSLIYVGIFVAWYVAHPTSYAGNTINLHKATWFHDWANASSYFIQASLPLFHNYSGYALVHIDGETGEFASYAVSQEIGSVLSNIQVSQIARSLVIMILFAMSVNRLPQTITRQSVKGIAAIGLSILILPAIVISLSPAYQEHVKGGWAPLHVTFFGYFGAILLICLLTVLFLKALPLRAKNGATYVLAALIGGGALFADVFNSQVAQAMHINSQRWSAAAILIRYSRSVQLPKQVIAPQMYDYVGKPGPLPKDYWKKLFKLDAGVEVDFMATAPAGSPEPSAKMYYDCPNKRDCTVLLQRRDLQTIEVISNSFRPRFLHYLTSAGGQAIKLDLIQMEKPSLVAYGLYSAKVPISVDLSSIKID